ncbi:DUF3179 domain-containing (seleno)protein [Paludisphaera mucosa]|uniref:DUF3179 domain-containing (Seleno)protein n=1 Tax=Paludisphaera mucosa TaxID=3030827 RepID=A0ABT6F687_9BACT|nr:DUF3179 domain-containing (seleno)protein [Paludisphaera mucosa]MDG3003098.1 DUF3179 domain-containing (seleno)protein [Paludisphaera mucosa]
MQPHVTALNLDSASSVPLDAPRGRPRAVVAATFVLLLGVPMALLGRFLWHEWNSLLVEEESAAASAVIGYPNIYPAISRAARPADWRRVEGRDLLVWSGWKDGEGHRWFKLLSEDCDPQLLGDPVGRDVARAIDYPAVETSGGPIWERVPSNAHVAGFDVGKIPCVYPKMVLAKVLVVNDLIDGTPLLVHHDPFVAASGSAESDVAVYDPRIDGRRITLGCGGFSIGRKHVLYDRGTESLWVDQVNGLVAFSGKLKGKTLPLVQRVPTKTWRDWQSENPDSRLLVGSLDRARGIPAE